MNIAPFTRKALLIQLNTLAYTVNKTVAWGE